MKLVIDRFEGTIAVIELPNGHMVDCPKALLPDNAKEGSILNITVDENDTDTKLKKITSRMNNLFKD